MASKAHGLLAQIETDVLDSSVPVSLILQKVIILGGRVESEKMRDWARQEIRGYVGGTVPHYRKLAVPLYAQITNPYGHNGAEQRIAPNDLPRQIRDLINPNEMLMTTGVGGIEAMIEEGSAEPHRLINANWGDALRQMLNKYYVDPTTTKVVATYFQVPNSTLKGLLVEIRTALAELVAELVASLPEGTEEPSPSEADRAMQIVITGERNTVTYNNQHSTSGSNIAAPYAGSAVVATDTGTAIGSQTASGDGASAVGTQTASGEHTSITGGPSAPDATPVGGDIKASTAGNEQGNP